MAIDEFSFEGGRGRRDPILDLKFVVRSHNTIRGWRFDYNAKLLAQEGLV